MNNEKHYNFSPAAGLISSQQRPNWVVDNLIEKGEQWIMHIPVENEHLFRFKMNADSGLRVHRFRTPQCTYSDVR
ncbi:hypothetical protein [Aeromonas sp. ASNIH7]|uniref:hypothetical protein n=1 Tax=Aeromonas sp. ASNIH7 TaxID=1920107 RepID=UPI0018F7FEFD|nr:hypothetical protein [Aeromonas sp. ASNIH7]